MLTIKTFIKTYIFVALFFCAIQTASAQVPRTLSYQGLLTDASGRPVSDGNYSLTFKLYDAASSGNLLWTENQPTVTATRGIINVVLGSVQSLTPTFAAQYYLGITIASGSELTPRVKLTSSPYSMMSAGLQGSNGLTATNISNDSTLSSISPSALTTEKAVKNYVDIQISSANRPSPIGSVMGWLKSYPNTPSLIDGWVECNGQILNDASSPYNGQTIPALNGNSETTKKYLRGSTTSGGVGGIATHTHNPGATYQFIPGQGINGWRDNASAAESNIPPYYEVVWIMKIK